MDYSWFIYLYGIIGVCIFAYYIIEACVTEFKQVYRKAAKTQKRKKLLKQASPYLQPFANIWKYQNLSNRFIQVELKVHVINITSGNRKLNIKGIKQDDLDDAWDLILYNFNNYINYEELTNIIQSSKLNLICDEKFSKLKKAKTKTKRERLDEDIEKQNNAIDVNNCSEIELTQLAGINIILAKKIIIHREDIKGFKSKDEFIRFVNLKSHFQKQIKNSIIIKKVKINKPIKLTKERLIDL